MSAIDVVIVGAGPSGLAAATALREAGAGRVVVLDRELTRRRRGETDVDDVGANGLQCRHRHTMKQRSGNAAVSS